MIQYSADPCYEVETWQTEKQEIKPKFTRLGFEVNESFPSLV